MNIDDVRVGLMGMAMTGVLHTGILYAVNTLAPDPCLEEDPLVRQTQRYCAGDFGAWDPQIGTFPGLELVGALFGTVGGSCGVGRLRILSSVFAALMYFSLFSTARVLHPHLKRSETLLKALGEWLISPLFLMSFLFLEDQGSAVLVLAMQYQSLRGHFFVSAVFGFLAVLFQQSNVAWVAFVAGAAALRECTDPSARKDPRRFALWAIRHMNVLAPVLWPYAVTCTAFVAFSIANGSPFIGGGGDGASVQQPKSPSPVVHLAQMLYLFVACGLVLFPTLFSHFTKWVRVGCHFRYSKRRILVAFVAIVAACIVVARWSTNVPSELIDDQHRIVFRLWRFLLGSHWLSRYMAAPVYAICLLVTWHLVGQQRDPLWWLLLLLCSSVSLVPYALVEPRNYTIPMLLLRISIVPPLEVSPVPTFLFHLAVEAALCAASLWAFLAWPLQVTPAGGLARVVW